ncbi:ABC transporter ATP-binding protein [Gottschalkia acidurici 9a]|uniref:ABC transporter ATP-binding protein n=1 Tax=Gottschalkia acidurici (strain ATCC 7906 / DSM 604 / BCRC 14475 / CIP 104303 / KCTC 5404 / NCIMB 10678 / 9a) TaxID=1128398 RepID=K0B1X8_GOTA9|nr:ATP-binding cassette domain-containing protein [Gottschalkia acidurici]AFS78920.1 ABC transporter ATP-binding protein [Gottschalkia acidurici 9a]
MESIKLLKIEDIFKKYTYAEDFFISLSINNIDSKLTLEELTLNIKDEILEDNGLTREQLVENFISFIEKMEELKKSSNNTIESITIIGGQDKFGNDENVVLELKVGDVVSIVGPTGSGKSRLLGDIECLAQNDTPTNRQVLLNGEIPDVSKRFSIENKLVAQLSQNMNFVMDLSVEEFVKLHAESRMIENIGEIVEEIVHCANELAGEKFNKSTPLTQLSGGQSRALMIADTALLSLSPIVLIDEIENAGIDRKNAIELLVKKEKIVLISTHDPVLALIGDKRIVIKNGGIHKVINSSNEEKRYIDTLEKIDKKMMDIRNHIRLGGIIDDNIVNF